MKRILVIASIAMLAACNSNDTEKTDSMKSPTDSPMTPAVRDINSPYPVMYSSKFTVGDPKNAETILALWKDWDAGDLSASKGKFADSIELHLSDGSMMSGSADSIISMVQKFRTSMGTVTSRVDAVMSVKSADKNEDWALIWGLEKSTNSKGKSDSSYLQETWRLDKDGKVNLLYQFKAAGAPPKK